MASNLKDRLKRIHEIKKNEPERIIPEKSGDNLDLINLGWNPCGYKVMEREVILPSSFKSIKNLPAALSVLIPDLRFQEIPKTEEFLFFDLETTGLSGGAGTVAFLAAFGRIKSGKLVITQYLLLDYPGENDLLKNVIAKLNAEKQVIVSYNGKCFDSQIIKTRCLMNRIKAPVYRHADLLHPARRLWKNIIQDCSQISVETKILGLSREGDIPGALAPEIWFEFLKTGKTDRLAGICDHNLSDISGLCQMLCAMIQIADDPVKCAKFNFDIERLSLFWRDFLRRTENQDNELRKTGEKILEQAAVFNKPRAAYVYSYEQMRKGNYEESLKYTQRALKLFEKDSIWHEKLLRRKERLIKKINHSI